jgi:nitrite reductase/ring-hydroxylating ferredoxin subunit
MQTVYVICALNDIQSRRARGFHLLRITQDGKTSPYPIVIIRWGRQVFGYVNRCPHHQSALDWEPGQFLDPSGMRVMCGKHGALFEIADGACVDGPCLGQALESIPVTVIDGDICIQGIELAENETLGATEA